MIRGQYKSNVHEWNAWLKSDEFQKLMDDQIKKMNEQEELDEINEKKSDLKYKDGQKVLRGDVFIDEYHENLKENPYGTTSYVYRINEDDTIDNCFSSCSAWKANNYEFNPERSRLIRRNGIMQDAMSGSITVE